MPVPRFYRVLRGQRGTAAKTKFLDYLEKLNSEPNVGSRGNRPDFIKLFVDPFGIELGNELILETSALSPSYNTLKAAVTAARVKTAPDAGTAGLKLRSAKAARVSATTGLTATGTIKTSALTGLKYADYGGTSFSCPFGRATATESESEAFSAIRTALGATYKRVHLIEERI